ncbi:MAG: hypothetical protein JJD97_14830, partial [Gemmatimonadaceae bacterium]|nr:hypothetical protein [Gemmatimonadaceae bacterium]
MSAPARELRAQGTLEFPLSAAAGEQLARAALEEDRAFDDVTTLSVVPADARASAIMVARSGGVIAGIPLAVAVFRLLDRDAKCRAR